MYSIGVDHRQFQISVKRCSSCYGPPFHINRIHAKDLSIDPKTVTDGLAIRTAQAKQCVDQIDQEAEGNERSERIVKDHNSFSSIPVDGMGVADRKCEETERERNHQNVHHRSLPCA